MENRVLKIISLLFHPLFFPVYTLLALLFFPWYLASLLPLPAKLMMMGTVVLTTVLVPLLFIYVLYRKKIIRSLYLESRPERIYPLLTVAVCYYITYYLLKEYPVSMLFSYYMLGCTFLAILSLILTFYMKISLHMVGTGGFLGMLVGLALNFSYPLAGAITGMILVCGLVGYIRLKTNSHKPSEVYAGFLVGAVVMFLLFFFV
jgi:hypothetical protein